MQVEGFLSFLYWGRGCVIHMDFCAGLQLQTGMHTAKYTHTSAQGQSSGGLERSSSFTREY